MRSGAWLGAWGLYVIVACNTTYTAAPTACDDWCEATHGLTCGEYEPAACVSACEIETSKQHVDCSPGRDAVVRCLQEHPGALAANCSSGTDSPCWEELLTLYDCNHGVSAEDSACGMLCLSFVSSVCPTPKSDGCWATCKAYGLASARCRTERQAVVECTDQHAMYCPDDPTDFEERPELDPATLPCKPERDALQTCALLHAGEDGAGGDASAD